MHLGALNLLNCWMRYPGLLISVIYLYLRQLGSSESESTVQFWRSLEQSLPAMYLGSWDRF